MNLSVPEKHQLRVARQTLKYSNAGALIMGGPTKDEAALIIYRLTGRCAHPLGLDLGGDCPVCGSGV